MMPEGAVGGRIPIVIPAYFLLIKSFRTLFAPVPLQHQQVESGQSLCAISGFQNGIYITTFPLSTSR